MKVLRAKSAGFCMGVSLALRRLDAALEGAGRDSTKGTLSTLGPVIHNPRVIAAYEKKGVSCLSGVAEARHGDTVLIRAHGVRREEEAMLAAQGVLVIDATCPRVKQAQIAIATQRKKGGGTLLLYGEADHPEVKGLISYAENDAHVFLDMAELDAIELDPDKAYFLAAQTTQDTIGFAPVCERVRERLGHAVPVLQTICDATRKRQSEVIALARSVGIMVVVGGVNSGNTRRLAEVARGQGVAAVQVEDVHELDAGMFAGVDVAGLTAGASTPMDHIDAVEEWIKAL